MEVITDVKIWLLILYQLTFSIPNGAFTTVSLLIELFQHLADLEDSSAV